MLSASDLLTLAGASAVTSAVYFVIAQFNPNLPRAVLIYVISEVVVWVGGAISERITASSGILLFLDGFIVAAAALGGIHSIIDRPQDQRGKRVLR